MSLEVIFVAGQKSSLSPEGGIDVFVQEFYRTARNTVLLDRRVPAVVFLASLLRALRNGQGQWHLHGHLVLFLVPVLRMLGRPVACYVHSYEHVYEQRVVRRLALRLSVQMLRLASEVHSVGEHVAATLPVKSSLVRLVRSESEVFRLDQRCFDIALGGRLSGEKGVDLILRLERELPQARILFIGNLPAEILSRTSTVRCTGWVAPWLVASLLTGVRAYVSFSRHEGHPLMVVDAVAHCDAVFLTDIPGHRYFGSARHVRLLPSDDALIAAVGAYLQS